MLLLNCYISYFQFLLPPDKVCERLKMQDVDIDYNVAPYTEIKRPKDFKKEVIPLIKQKVSLLVF